MCGLVPMPSRSLAAPAQTSSRPRPACPGICRDSPTCALPTPCHHLQLFLYLSYSNICLRVEEAVSASPTTYPYSAPEHATRQTSELVLQVHRPNSGLKRASSTRAHIHAYYTPLT